MVEEPNFEYKYDLAFRKSFAARIAQEAGTTPSRRLIMKNEMTEVGRLRTFFFSVCREHNIDDDTAKTLNRITLTKALNTKHSTINK